VTVGVDLTAQGGHGKPALVKLTANGQPIGEGTIPRIAFRWALGPLEVERNSVSPVSSEYKDKGAFPFAGAIACAIRPQTHPSSRRAESESVAPGKSIC
jgi:hypothetical protein